jgi:GTP cyclohydrolase IA
MMAHLTPARPLPDAAAAERACDVMLERLGLAGHVDAATPRRLVAALAELTAGLHANPDTHLSVTFTAPSEDPGMVVVPGIAFRSLCEHHLLPFTGTATVGYLPVDRIVGLSKLARLVTGYATRPQVQERLGDQIIAAIVKNLPALGAACVLTSVHTCMTLRGACADGASMVTSHLAGRFRDDPAVRAEFLSLAALAGPPR